MPHTLTTPSPGPLTVVFVDLKSFAALSWGFSAQVSARTGHPHSLSSSLHTLSCPLAELPSQIVMSVLELANGDLCLCSCGCNHRVHQSTEWHHKKLAQPKSPPPPPPKRRRIAHFQAESPVITPDKQKRTRADNISSSSHSLVDTSDCYRLYL